MRLVRHHLPLILNIKGMNKLLSAHFGEMASEEDAEKASLALGPDRDEELKTEKRSQSSQKRESRTAGDERPSKKPRKQMSAEFVNSDSD